MALFVDLLDIWLQVLAWGLLAGAAWVLYRFAMAKDPQAAANLDRGFGYMFTAIGIYALAMGLWGSFTWPLPSSYNIVLMDPYALYGIAYLALGLSLIYGADLRGPLWGVAFLSISPIVYGADILHYHLTLEPAAAAVMFVVIGVAGLLSPLLTFRRVSRYWAYVEVVLLIVGALLSAYIGASATFEHTAGWMKWTPFYG